MHKTLTLINFHQNEQTFDSNNGMTWAKNASKCKEHFLFTDIEMLKDDTSNNTIEFTPFE